MPKSVLYTFYSVKKCLLDSLSVLFEVGAPYAAPHALSYGERAAPACVMLPDPVPEGARASTCASSS